MKNNQGSDLLRPKQAASYLNISAVTLWRFSQRDPSFPPKIKASPRTVFFRKTDIDAWLITKEI